MEKGDEINDGTSEEGEGSSLGVDTAVPTGSIETVHENEASETSDKARQTQPAECGVDSSSGDEDIAANDANPIEPETNSSSSGETSKDDVVEASVNVNLDRDDEDGNERRDVASDDAENIVQQGAAD